MSINKMQADALAEGFLDDIGSGSIDDLQPKETMSVLFQLVGSFIDDAQKNLKDSNSNASGKLSESIAAEEPVTSVGHIQVDVSMLLYGQFINKGVRGTKSGSGEYAFKNEFVGSKMIKSLKTYISSGKTKTRSSNRIKTTSKNEQKNFAISDISSAFAMGRAIKQHGIKATNFIDKAVEKTNNISEELLGQAFTIDIINSLPDTL